MKSYYRRLPFATPSLEEASIQVAVNVVVVGPHRHNGYNLDASIGLTPTGSTRLLELGRGSLISMHALS